MPDEIRARVEVTAADIAQGCRGKRSNCPIALALHRALPKVYRVEVLYKHAYIRLESQGHYLSAPLPDSAVEFIEAFDAEREAKPIQFEVSFAHAF